jgi:hypothetical protein
MKYLGCNEGKIATQMRLQFFPTYGIWVTPMPQRFHRSQTGNLPLIAHAECRGDSLQFV